MQINTASPTPDYGVGYDGQKFFIVVREVKTWLTDMVFRVKPLNGKLLTADEPTGRLTITQGRRNTTLQLKQGQMIWLSDPTERYPLPAEAG